MFDLLDCAPVWYRFDVPMQRDNFRPSVRQRRICELVSRGFADKEIAVICCVSEDTIGKELDFMFTHAPVEKRTRTALAMWFLDFQRAELAGDERKRQEKEDKRRVARIFRAVFKVLSGPSV
jgi:hypothetical protein